MERESTLKIGFPIHPQLFLNLAKKYGTRGAKVQLVFLKYLSKKSFTFGQLILCLKTFLYNHSKKLKNTEFIPNYEDSRVYKNGSISGLLGLAYRSEIDIGFPPTLVIEGLKQIVDVSYPVWFYYVTFFTKKPEYEPKLFGIFQIFSLTVWISIAFAFIAILFLSYFVFKRKYNFKQIFFHVSSVLLRQGTLVVPSSFFETAIVYSWVFGSMFLCLAFDSVILSFFSFPPVTKITSIAELASAVVNTNFHCVAPNGNIPKWFKKRNNKNLNIIAQDILTNKLRNDYDSFKLQNIQPNIAYFLNGAHLYRYRKIAFVSEDRALEYVSAIIVRKGFRYKMGVDKFVHIMLASGIKSKIFSDADFLNTLDFYTREYARHFKDLLPQRKLTLTDVAPAFIFLVTGYVLSILVFLVEVFLNRNKKWKCLQKGEKKEKKII